MKSLFTECASPSAFCRYRIEAERNLHIEEYAGRVGLEDLKDLASVVASDPKRSDGHNRLVDLSCAELNLSSDDVLRFGLLMRSAGHRTEGWHAFAVGDASTFSMVRMFSQWARVSDRSRIFNSRGEAERWLEVNSRRGMMPMAARNVA